VDPADLGRRGSLALQRPTVFHHVADPAGLQTAARELFDAHARGVIKARIHDRVPLREVAEAHRMLESRATQGALLLIP
jgi:NADPH2:quinone reductase